MTVWSLVMICESVTRARVMKIFLIGGCINQLEVYLAINSLNVEIHRVRRYRLHTLRFWIIWLINFNYNVVNFNYNVICCNSITFMVDQWLAIKSITKFKLCNLVTLHDAMCPIFTFLRTVQWHSVVANCWIDYRGSSEKINL